LIGAQVEQVGEHLLGPTAQFIFEYNCYPEAKILSSSELRALHQDLGSWYRVAELVGASEAFVRQHACKSKKDLI
jgi:hypothetical protein